MTNPTHPRETCVSPMFTPYPPKSTDSYLLRISELPYAEARRSNGGR